MKKIEAIIKPEKLEPLKDELVKAKIDGMTIHQVYGCGNQHGWTEHYRGTDVIMNTLPKVYIMLIVNDNKVEEITKLIIDTVKTDSVGDGKIFISNIEDCIRIRTGETGEIAI